MTTQVNHGNGVEINVDQTIVEIGSNNSHCLRCRNQVDPLGVVCTSCNAKIVAFTTPMDLDLSVSANQDYISVLVEQTANGVVYVSRVFANRFVTAVGAAIGAFEGAMKARPF